jgi:eukaryotic-like serine/threonine-protein kinase
MLGVDSCMTVSSVPRSGLLFGRFQVLELAGRGRHAEVFKVRVVPSGEVMALKVLRTATPELSERLFREGQIQSQLMHPHIAEVVEVIHVDDEVGLLMDFIDGPSLEELLRPGKPWKLDEALGIFRQLLSALAYAHNAGVVHRDLTPANILLFEDEQGEMSVRIIDFGLAKRVASTEWEVDEEITHVGESLGTPGYVAPEQHTDASKVDLSADMFSLGAILYELVCGQPAFPRLPNLVDTVQAAMACEFEPVDTIVKDCPFEVVAGIQRALSRDPAARFSGCSEFMLAVFGELLEEAPPAVRLTIGRRDEAAKDYRYLQDAMRVLDNEFRGTRAERLLAAAAILALLGVVAMAVSKLVE